MNHSLSKVLYFCLCFILVKSEAYYSTDDAWRYGIPVSIGVSLIGFVMTALVLSIRHFMSMKFDSGIIYLVAFACGALLGDVFFHILPSSSESLENYSSEEKTNSYFMVLIGFFLFFVVEKAFLAFGITHSHEIENQKEEQGEIVQNKNNIHEVKDSDKGNNQIFQDFELNLNLEKLESNNSPPIKPTKCISSWKGRHTEGWLNLLSDFLHNILDGIAIGIVYSSSEKSTIIATVIAVVAHEIPGEMADIGVLLNSKFNNCQILFCNSVVNITAIIGCIIGLALGDSDKKSQVFLNQFVAGNFIYISTVSMFPILVKEKSYVKNIFIFICFWIGVISLYSIMFAEEEEHGHEH